MNIIEEYEEYLEAMKQQKNTKLLVGLKIEDATLYDVFTLIDDFKNSSVHNLHQNEKISFILELSGIIQVLKLENIDIASIKRKILNYVAKFHTLDILSKDVKVDNFILSLDYNIALFNN